MMPSGAGFCPSTTNLENSEIVRRFCQCKQFGDDGSSLTTHPNAYKKISLSFLIILSTFSPGFLQLQVFPSKRTPLFGFEKKKKKLTLGCPAVSPTSLGGGFCMKHHPHANQWPSDSRKEQWFEIDPSVSSKVGNYSKEGGGEFWARSDDPNKSTFKLKHPKIFMEAENDDVQKESPFTGGPHFQQHLYLDLRLDTYTWKPAAFKRSNFQVPAISFRWCTT